MAPVGKKYGTPAVDFKRAIAATTRAIAGERELEVNFGTDRPGLAGNVRSEERRVGKEGRSRWSP